MEEEKKIYLGNLAYDLTEEDVRKAIEEKGVTVKEVKLISDRNTGRAKGFGFAEFETEEDANKAIDALNGVELNGRTLKVNKAQKMKPRTDRGPRGGFGGGGYSGGGGGYSGGGGGYSGGGGRFKR
ncbi:MAG: RNA-binding protein [Omnitrophica bacterium]|nr:RNA-binding protein [Candidatus Omnitrophota bacterium]